MGFPDMYSMMESREGCCIQTWWRVPGGRMEFMRRVDLSEAAPLEECCKEPGRGPTSTKWVDVSMGSEGSPDGCCSLEAGDFEAKGGKGRRSGIFAAMPCRRWRRSRCSSNRLRGGGYECRDGQSDRKKWMFLGIKNPHSNGNLKPSTCLRGGMVREREVWKAQAVVVQQRPAANAWGLDYSGSWESSDRNGEGVEHGVR